ENHFRFRDCIKPAVIDRRYRETRTNPGCFGVSVFCGVVMFITKKHLSRRTVLKGMGAAVSLPFLEAMVPAQTRLSQTAASPRSGRACIGFVPGDAGSTTSGTDQPLHMPVKEGRAFEFTRILKPLEPFRDYLTVVSMMDCHPADPFAAEEVGADHFRSSAVFLTGSHPKQTMRSDIYCG